MSMFSSRTSTRFALLLALAAVAHRLWLAGSAAGLAAALLFAFPDRYTSWYTHTPDTSYGAFLPLATLILWLAVEIEARDARGWRLWIWLALLGAAGGLACWTNAGLATRSRLADG